MDSPRPLETLESGNSKDKGSLRKPTATLARSRNPEMNWSDRDRDLRGAASRTRERGKKKASLGVDTIDRRGRQPTGEVSVAEQAVWRPRGEYKISRAG